MRSTSRFPKCPYCGCEFSYKPGYYRSGEKVQLQHEWSKAHDYSGKHTREMDCPECGKKIRIGYECVMYAISEKVKQ